MDRSASRSTWLDVLITALAPAIWGSTYIVTTEILPPDRPFTAALLRALPAGLLLVLYSRYLPRRSEWPRLLVLAALNIGFFQPLLVMGLVWSMDQQRPASVAVAASVVGIAGMAALLLAPGASWDPIGIAAAFIGTACMASGTYLTRRWRPTVPLLAFTGWQLLIGGLFLLPVAWLIDPPLPQLSPLQWLGYAYLSLFGALLAYVLWFRGIARLAPVAVSSLGLLSPLVAVLLGWALLGQSITGVALLGLTAVLGSILAVQWATAAKPAVAAPHVKVARCTTPTAQGDN